MTTTSDFADWLAIANLKARYCRLLDTKDWDGYGALFTDDVIIDTSAAGGPRFEGRDSALNTIRDSIGDAKTVHQVHSPEIEISGDKAMGIWAMYDRVEWTNGRSLTGHGHYHEQYVRIAGEWRIAESRLTRLHVEMQQPGSV